MTLKDSKANHQVVHNMVLTILTMLIYKKAREFVGLEKWGKEPNMFIEVPMLEHMEKEAEDKLVVIYLTAEEKILEINTKQPLHIELPQNVGVVKDQEKESVTEHLNSEKVEFREAQVEDLHSEELIMGSQKFMVGILRSIRRAAKKLSKELPRKSLNKKRGNLKEKISD